MRRLHDPGRPFLFCSLDAFEHEECVSPSPNFYELPVWLHFQNGRDENGARIKEKKSTNWSIYYSESVDQRGGGGGGGGGERERETERETERQGETDRETDRETGREVQTHAKESRLPNSYNNLRKSMPTVLIYLGRFKKSAKDTY